MTKTAQLALSRGIAESIPGNRRNGEFGVARADATEGSAFLETSPRSRHSVGPRRSAVEEEFLRRMRPTSLIDVGRARRGRKPVVFLAGEGSSAITGAALRVDGGVVRSIV